MAEDTEDPGDRTAMTVSPMIGVTLGDQYLITGILGEGGMGMIYRGRQLVVDREVAIKFLPQDMAHDQINVQRLAREAKALGRLSHPNIVTTYDFRFTDKQEPYLVFEFVDGESLQTYLARRGSVPFAESVPLFIQLADAMKYAHANGVVHRDIKPHNIMVIEADGKTSVKILDFGIAQMKSESQKLTRTGEIWGSPNYMSPEQCTGEEVDHLTDIYSLGVVMYKTLSSQLPHSGKSFAQTVSQKLTEPVPFFASLELAKPVVVPEVLEEIVIKCLRRDRDERYQSMAQLKTALVDFAIKAGIIEGDNTGKYGGGNKEFQKSANNTNVNRPNTLSKPVKAVGGSKGSAGKSADQVKSGSTSRATAAGAGPVKKKLPAWVLPVVALLGVLVVAAIGMLCGVEFEANTVKSGPSPKPPDNALHPQPAANVPAQQDNVKPPRATVGIQPVSELAQPANDPAAPVANSKPTDLPSANPQSTSPHVPRSTIGLPEPSNPNQIPTNTNPVRPLHPGFDVRREAVRESFKQAARDSVKQDIDRVKETHKANVHARSSDIHYYRDRPRNYNPDDAPVHFRADDPNSFYRWSQRDAH